jgi:tRNA-2-methylthio-N6-dimethylallyladenosine synthase
MTKTYFIRTFGCQMNEADSQRIATKLENKGYHSTKNINQADLVVINSCVVRESAENRVYGLINNLKDNNQKIILTGCLAGWALRDKTKKNLNKLKDRIGNKIDIKLTQDMAGFDIEQKQKENQDWAYIPISNGCNNFCSYCIVPYARGRETSRSQEEIIKDVHCALKKGNNQIMLLGQNVNSWQGKKNGFANLLNQIAQIDGVKKLTFMSANPQDFNSQLIKVIASNPNISRQLHIPLQSGDNKILKKMNRPYTQQDYLDLISAIKKEIPKAEFTTDILIGFPGETKKAFQNTVKVCKKVGFKQAFLNKYSPRPGTVATSNYKDNIPMDEKKRRWKILEELINL